MEGLYAWLAVGTIGKISGTAAAGDRRIRAVFHISFSVVAAIMTTSVPSCVDG